MPKWIIRETSYGTDRAKLHHPATHHLKEMVAELEDCDGDFTAWSVTEGGVLVEHGQERGKNAWEVAKKKAEYVICYGSKRFKERQLTKLAEHFNS